MADVHRAALELGIEVLGGHTEVAPGVTSPIISMTAVGRAPRDRLVTSGGAQPGDTLILTKWAALEGTAILATDLASHLEGRVSPEAIARAQGLTARMSVVRDGIQAAELGATALHDPTEGGILGALWELSEASGLRLRGGRLSRADPGGDAADLRCLRGGPAQADLQRRDAGRLPGPGPDTGRPCRAPDPGHADRAGDANGIGWCC